jgi:hypothetical protein
MASALVFALSLAGFGLLVFGERMGLPAPLAAAGVTGVFLAALAALALASATSRLARYLIGSERGAATCLLAITACLAAFALPLALDLGQDRLSTIVALAAGLVAALMLSPFNPWREDAMRAATAGRITPGETVSGDGLQDRAVPGDTTRGALPLFRLAIAAGALVLVVRFFPLGIDRIAEAGGWDRGRVFLIGLGGLAFLVVLGGLSSLGRAALVLISLVLVLGVLPVLAGLAGAGLARVDLAGLSLATIAGRASEIIASVGVPGLPKGLRPEWPAAILGFALGMMLLQPAASVPAARRSRRALAVVTGLATAGAIGWIATHQSATLAGLIGSAFEAAPPAQWPVFAFDETLRGWLTACNTLPEDANAAARACALPSPRQPLPPGSLSFATGLGPPALALAEGWPIILGFIWGLLGPLVELVALGFLLHAASTGLAEGLFHRVLHPRALRSWRLAISRLTLLGLVAAIALLWRHDLRLEAPLFRWLLLGLAMIALNAMIGYRLIRLVRRLRLWREARLAAKVPAKGAPADTTPTVAAL